MSGNSVRHFLDLIDIPKPTLAGLITQSFLRWLMLRENEQT